RTDEWKVENGFGVAESDSGCLGWIQRGEWPDGGKYFRSQDAIDVKPQVARPSVKCSRHLHPLINRDRTLRERKVVGGVCDLTSHVPGVVATHYPRIEPGACVAAHQDDIA